MLSLIQISILALLANGAPLPTLENTDFLIPGTMITTTENEATNPAVIQFWQGKVAAQKQAENEARAQTEDASVEKWLFGNRRPLPPTDHLIPGTSMTGTAKQATNPRFLQRVMSRNRAWALDRTDQLIPGTKMTGTAAQAAHPEVWQQMGGSKVVASGNGIESAVARAAPGFLDKTKAVLSKLRFW